MTGRRCALLVAVLLTSVLAAGSAAATKRFVPANRTKPRISGSPLVGRTLRATRGAWSGHPTRYRFNWLDCNRSGKRCRKIAGTRARSYKLAARDLGHRIRVSVTASNRRGSGHALSRATAVVGKQSSPPPPPPPPPPGPPPAGAVVVNNTSLGSLSTRFTTNNVYTGMIDDNQTTVANFRALQLPLVRLHVGDDGGLPAMPEIHYNQWSFANLDVLVNDETAIGLTPMINIKFAPDWMWTCTSFGQPGHVADLTFQTYAAYMARLVSYYNLGYMTTETGATIINPAGTANRITYWEPWNEPDLANETPCVPDTGVALTPSEYLTMWNAVTQAMLAVDPTLKFVGPASGGGQFGSGGGSGNDYINNLMQQAVVQPTILSFHGYGYWDNDVPDAWIFDGDNTGAGGIPDFVNAATNVHAAYPQMPIWIDEMNVNAAWGDDSHHRPWNEFAAAWWATAYSELSPLNVALLDQYNVVESPQFGLLDYDTGNPYLAYWILKTMNASFPADSTRLDAVSPDRSQIETTAARRPDGRITVLVADRKVDPNNPDAGHGLPEDVVVALQGIDPAAVTLQQIDKNTPSATGPTTVNLPVSTQISLHFPGYGLALLTITPH